jgi:hypothetical protein
MIRLSTIIITILFQFVTINSFGNTYSDYQGDWSWDEFTEVFVGGGGSVKVSIQNDVLEVDFNASFTMVRLKTGEVVQIASNPTLPDIDLGPINSFYKAEIKNGHIWIESKGHSKVSGFNVRFIVDLSDSNLEVIREIDLPQNADNTHLPTLPDEYQRFDNDYSLNKNYVLALQNIHEDSYNESTFLDQYRRKTINYFDDFGRIDQSININFNIVGSDTIDLISSFEYNGFWQDENNYLPYAFNARGYFQTNWKSDQSSFYQNSNNAIVNDSNPFSVNKFDGSPLNRIIKVTNPGIEFENNPKEFTYLINTANDEVIDFAYINGNLYAEGFFNIHSLFKTVNTDENENIQVEYKNIFDQVVLKKVQEQGSVALTDHDGWACTYYVYDNYGNLKFVLPPKLVEEIISDIGSGYMVPREKLKSLAFQYEYDGRNRMIRKKVPGADWVDMGYDNRDRLVLTQDGVQRFKERIYKACKFTKYDALNRPVMTGEVNLADRHLNTLISDFYGEVENTGSKYYESRGSSLHGYDNTSFPVLSGDYEVQTVTYYDDYEMLNETHFNTIDNQQYDLSYQSGQPGFEESDADLWASMKGQVTTTKTRILNSDNFIHTVTYYDWKYRPIQIQSTNQFGGKDVIFNLYDFVGNLTHSREVYSLDPSGSEQYVINKEYIYDHADRLLEVYHQIGDDGENVLVLQNKYNELGELIEKNLHAGNVNEPDNTNYLQSLDYRYNIRGWLQSINTPTTRPDAAINPDDNSQVDDAFGMELLYTNPTLND